MVIVIVIIMPPVSVSVSVSRIMITGPYGPYGPTEPTEPIELTESKAVFDNWKRKKQRHSAYMQHQEESLVLAPTRNCNCSKDGQPHTNPTILILILILMVMVTVTVTVMGGAVVVVAGIPIVVCRAASHHLALRRLSSIQSDLVLASDTVMVTRVALDMDARLTQVPMVAMVMVTPSQYP